MDGEADQGAAKNTIANDELRSASVTCPNRKFTRKIASPPEWVRSLRLVYSFVFMG